MSILSALLISSVFLASLPLLDFPVYAYNAGYANEMHLAHHFAPLTQNRQTYVCG